MKRKRLTPKQYRNRPVAEKIFAAMDPAVANDTVVLYKVMRDLEGKITKMMCIPNPKL